MSESPPRIVSTPASAQPPLKAVRQPQPADICGIVVTYRPDADSLKCLQVLTQTLAHTVVVDNASGDAVCSQLRQCPGEKLTFVANFDNLGVGTALNQGIRAAHQLGYRWYLLLDQDTRLLPETLTGLIAVQRACQTELGDSLALIGSNYFHQRADGSVRHAEIPFTDGKLWHIDDHVITAGTLISWASYDAIGPFRGDFFIDHIDHEYCLRAQLRKMVVVRTAQPLMVHRIGMMVQRRTWMKLWRKKTFNGYSPLRRYYQIRNYLAMAREYEAAFPEFIARQRKHIFKEAKRGLFYDGRFFANLRAIAQGFWHGWRGQLGPWGAQPKESASQTPPPLPAPARTLMKI